MATLTLFLFVVMILAFCSTIYFSILSRRKGNPAPLSRSYMNISMGILFIALAVHLYTFQLPLLAKILATLILVVGLINVYYAIKLNRRIKEHQTNQEHKKT